MRVKPNGFGAASVIALGDGLVATSSQFQSAGGIGPSTLGVPSAWINTGVYGGAASFADPVAQGPASGLNLTPATADASSIGSGPQPNHLASFYDLGINNGEFKTSVNLYIGYCVDDIPDTDLVIKIEEALRDDRGQSTRSFNGDVLLDCPIRLNVGATSGTQQYIEALQNLIGSASGYWQKRFLNPKSSLKKLHLSFYSYAGQPIPLEKMLQQREVLNNLELFVKISKNLNLDPDIIFSSFPLYFLFDPANPELLGRMKRYIQIIFKAEVYQGTAPGLEPNSFMNPNDPSFT